MAPRLIRIIRSEEDVVGLTLSLSDFLGRCRVPIKESSRCLTICSELAHNVVKYANIGRVQIEQVKDEDGSHIAINCRDEGPGIMQIGEAMCDGFSTGDTLGLGLPGVKRLSDHFEIDSVVGKGTVVTAHVDID